MQELVERHRVDAGHGFVARNQALVRELDGNAQRGARCALAGARLQHPQRPLLDGELEVLHVAVVLLEEAVDADEFGIGCRHGVLEGPFGRARFVACGFGDRLRRADAGDHVLALRIDEEFAVEALLAGRRVAGEGDAGRRRVTHVAEHHGLDVDGSAPAFRNRMQAPVGDGALVHPRAEHRADGAPELSVRVLGKRLVMLLGDAHLEPSDDLRPVVGGEIGIEHVAVLVLVLVQNLLEQMRIKPEHHIGIHGDEAAIRVVSEAAITGDPRQGLDGLIVEAEIEHGVHHAGHRRTRAGAHRHQQRIVGIAEPLVVGDATDFDERCLDGRLQLRRIFPVVGIEVGTDLGGDGETGRHRQAKVRHLGEVCALAAEKIAHFGGARRLGAAERIDPFRLGGFRSGRPWGARACCSRLRSAPPTSRRGSARRGPRRRF